MKKRLIPAVIILVIVMLPLIVWSSSLIKCEILTKVYYDDFEYAYTDNTMLDEMEYFKVLDCDGETARVYYVSKDMDWANVLTFENTDGAWVETHWEVIWSTTGSASEVVYPYLWHFIYGGF